jgi:hypothetical protein
MAVAKTARGQKQDRARVAGGQDYEVRYEAKKTGKAAAAVKKSRQEGRQCAQARGKAARPLRPGGPG